MSYIVLFALTWGVFYLFIDFKRVAELYPSALLSSFLGMWTDLFMERYSLWSYSAPPLSNQTIPLMLDISIYPVVAILYVQAYPHGSRLRRQLLYTLCWVAPALCLEWFFLLRGEMLHHKWWSLLLSFCADWLIFGILINTYRLLSPCAQRRRSSS